MKLDIKIPNCIHMMATAPGLACSKPGPAFSACSAGAFTARSVGFPGVDCAHRYHLGRRSDELDLAPVSRRSDLSLQSLL
jgi:hypothetical protein